MYAIRNKKTGKWLYGIKFGKGFKKVQLTSNENAKVFKDYADAENEIAFQYIREDYEIVKVKVVEEE